MSSVNLKTVNHGATLLKQLIRKLDAKGHNDGFLSTEERGNLQGKPGTTIEAILAVDSARSSAKTAGDSTVKGIAARVDVAKRLIASADKDHDGKIEADEKIPSAAGKALAEALLRFSEKHATDSIDHFEIPKIKK
jgi:hypothetical protein